MQKTTTPLIYNDCLIAGSTLIEGTVNIVNKDGSLTPEEGAFVYIYLNNILINEDRRIILSEEGRAGVITAVGGNASSRVGYWSFSCKPLTYGSYVTVKAQAPNKTMSDYSATYRVGGTPTPINIVSLKRDGTFGPPISGDTIIEGEFSGLKNSRYGTGVEATTAEPYFFPYNRNFDLYPYIDGIKQGVLPYNQIISRNFIPDFTFFGDDFDVDLLVQGESVNIRLDNFSQLIYQEIVTGVTGLSFEIHPPTTNWDLLYVYCGGVRLAQNVSSRMYDYSIAITPLGGVMVVLNSGFVLQPDEYFCIQYVEVNEINRDKYKSQVYQGTTDEVYTIPYSDSYSVYKNGLRMLEGADYDFVVSIDSLSQALVITFNRVGGNNIILLTDTIIIDYKLSDSVLPFYGVKCQNPAFVTPTIEDKHSDTANTRYFYLNIERGILSDPSYITIYKDGIKQRPLLTDARGQRISGDYTLQKVAGGYYRAVFSMVKDEEPFDYTTTVVDGVWSFTITNNFVVDFVYSKAAKEVAVCLLNRLPAMIDNKIEARFEIEPSTSESYLVLESPYTLEFPANSEKYQIYFSKYPNLYPGKDPQGHFKFFIDFRRNKWRYCFSKPLKKLMHLTAATFPRKQSTCST